MNKKVFTNKAPAAIGPYSQGILHKDTLYVSGQLPVNPETGELINNNISKATELIFSNINEILLSEDMNLENIVMVTIYMKDLSCFDEFNAAYNELFADFKPARATVGVSQLPKNADLEVSVIAKR